MRLIGDIHGKVIPYLDLVADCEESIQIGDFGMGFLTPYQTGRVEEVHRTGMHKFIRGNHDDPALCKESTGWIEDGFYDEVRDILYIGGAWSIDYPRRMAYEHMYGVKTWWEDEQLSLPELTRIHAQFVYLKPSIVITHDAPMQASKEMFFSGKYNMHGPHQSTRTAEALQAMFQEHQPDLWVFGHWHIPERKQIEGTEFVCLSELEHMDI